MITTKWKLHQGAFTPEETAQLTGVPPGSQRQWRSSGLVPKKADARGRVTLEEAIRFLAVSQLTKIRSLKLGVHLDPTVNYALLELACETMPWPFNGPLAEANEFRRWSSEPDRTRRWLKDQLNLATADVSRFTIVTPDGVSWADDFAAIEKRDSGRVHFVIDGLAITKHMSAAASERPFEVTRTEQLELQP